MIMSIFLRVALLDLGVLTSSCAISTSDTKLALLHSQAVFCVSKWTQTDLLILELERYRALGGLPRLVRLLQALPWRNLAGG